MTQFLTTLKIVLQLLPLIKEAISVLEMAVPEGGNGASKLATLKTWVETAFASMSEIGVQFESLWKMIEPLVALIVKATTKK